MIKSVLISFLVMTSVFSTVATAETSDTKGLLSGIEIQRVILDEELKRYEDELQSSLKELTKANTAYSASRSWLGFGAGDPNLEKAYLAAQRKHDEAKAKIQPKINTAQTQLRSVDRDLDIELRIVKKDQDKLENLQKQLKSAGLTTDFNQLQYRLDNTDDTLDEMEKIYDKAMIGSYVQDKIGQLLNSQVICTAQKRCGPTEPIKIEAEVIRKELFPESSSKNIRKDYYNKVNRGSN